MKNLYRLSLLALAAALLLPGCARQAAQPPTTPPPPAPGAKVLQLWTIWNANPRQAALAGIARAYEAAHPGVQVKITAYEPDAYKTSIKVAMGSSAAPDIFFTWSGEKMLHSFVRGGQVADLTAAMDAEQGAWRQRLIKPSLDRFSYDGKVWGVPYLLQCTFFFYNKVFFEEHGFGVPGTWEELGKLCKSIAATGMTPIALGNTLKWPAHHYPFVLTQRLLGQAEMEQQFDPLGPGEYSNAAFVRALGMFKSFADEGVFNKSPNGTSREAARALFYAEKAAMFYTGTWDFARLAKGGEAPEAFWGKWDFFNFPSVSGGRGEQAALAGAPDGYVVSAKSALKDEAIEFLKFMTSAEQAQSFVQQCQELVQVHGAVTEQNAGPQLRKYAEMVEKASGIAAWMDTMMEATVAEEYMNGVQGLLGGTETPEGIMEKVRARQAAVKKEMGGGQ